MLDRTRPQALPRVDARPHTTEPRDAEPLVAEATPSQGTCSHPGHDNEYWRRPDLARQHLASCGWCGELYNVGDHTGELMLLYPDAELNYKRHQSSPRHQYVLDAAATHQHDILARLDETLNDARVAQRQLQDPTRQGLKRILA